MEPVLITATAMLGGAIIAGLVAVYTSKQTRRQSEIVAMLDTFRQDNADLRDENRELRSELDERRKHDRP